MTVFRKAKKSDLSSIVKMLADDPLGSQREKFAEPLPDYYLSAFEKIDQDPNQALIVLEQDNEIIGTFQMTFIQYLNRRGSSRAMIESIRIAQKHRNKGLGKEIINWAINWSKEKGASILQLTSDKQRPDALRFYEKLGFEASHEGYKMHL